MIENPPAGRRAVQLLISPWLLVEWLRTGFPGRADVVSHGLPNDARITGATIGALAGYLILVIESESFDMVPEGGIPPIHDGPVFREVRGPKLEPSLN